MKSIYMSYVYDIYMLLWKELQHILLSEMSKDHETCTLLSVV